MYNIVKGNKNIEKEKIYGSTGSTDVTSSLF
jgi:hypothetical protein